MRKRLSLLTLLVAALAGGGLAMPGSAAASVEWIDPPGDATGLPKVESTPRPSDPELDVLKANFSTKGDSLVASLTVQRLATASGSFGSLYRYRFAHKDAEYYFLARTASAEYSQLGFSTTPGFYRVDPLGVEDEALKCDCKATFDAKSNTASLAIKLDSLKKTLRGGGELTRLYVQTLRRYPAFVDGDTARAPEKLALSL